ncbi:hypothetical protein [Halobacteriovorax sp.]|uniref:hypothetical protein n=1 Tax=Halobacteriovorax sp. TaxID=2020862 RepID=UPI003AF2B094
MHMAQRNFIIFKKILITVISWSLLFTPTANALAQQETTPTQQETSAHQEGTETETETSQQSTTQNSTPPSSMNPNYCHEDGSAKDCPSKYVYNCHLKSCVANEDNENYNQEYMKCGGSEKCQEELKADAKMFTEHKATDASSVKSKDDVLRYLKVAANIGYGCVLLGAGGCDTDFGLQLAAVIIMSSAVMSLMGDTYKDDFKNAKKRLENLEKTDEKGWNHRIQREALKAEIDMLKDMEKAAKKKMKHHQRTSTLISIVGILAGICIALTWTGCSVSNPCSGWAFGLSAVAFVLEMKANQIAKKAMKSAQSARQKAQKVLKKLESRYNNQYSAGRTQKIATSSAGTVGQSDFQNASVSQNEASAGNVQGEVISEVPEMNVNMGSLGTNGQNFLNETGGAEVIEGFNRTVKEGDTKYVNDSIDKNAAKISKAARKVLELVAKSKKADDKAKSAANAFLNPNSEDSQRFLANTLADNTSPIAMALNYRKAGGANASKELENNTKVKPETAVAYDSSSKDYLKKIKAQLEDYESLLADDTGIMAMSNFGDPTVDSNAVDQLNQNNKDPKETIHKDSGVSLWKIISNRYNEIKLKKILD